MTHHHSHSARFSSAFILRGEICVPRVIKIPLNICRFGILKMVNGGAQQVGGLVLIFGLQNQLLNTLIENCNEIQF